MSLKQTIWAWNLAMKPGPKFVLLALADYANDDGECYPSLKQLQKKVWVITLHINCAFVLAKRSKNYFSEKTVRQKWISPTEFISIKCKPKSDCRTVNP